MLGAFSSVLEGMPGGNYLGMILKILGIVAGIVVAVLGVLAKFDKLPWKLAMDERTLVLTRHGRLQQYKALLYTRKSWKQYWRSSVRKELNQGAPLKKHTEKLVYFVPWYMTPEEFDHRKNTQSLTTITIEKPSNQQWEAPLMIASVIGRSDTDIRKVWRAVQDRDENLRMRTGGVVTDALYDCESEDYVKRGISERITTATQNARHLIHLFTGIFVDEVWFPSGIYRTEVDAMRGLSPGTNSVVIAQQSNGHRPVGA